MKEQALPKTYVITGATSGIGLAAAEQLVRQDAAVIGVGRSAERCRQAEARLRAIRADADVHYCVADLSSLVAVRALAAEISALLAADGKTGLDGLVNNAGTFTYWFTLTPEGFEMQWVVNHLASFLLTNLLLPLLKAAPSARVVTVSSGNHASGRMNWEDLQLRRHYNGLSAYGNTKLANVLLTQELNRRFGEDSTVKAFAADPGLVKTEIGFKGTPALVRWVWQRRRAAGVSPEVSAKGIVYLLCEPSLRDSNEIYWKDSRPLRASRRALDGQSAQRLWALSERMCGL